MLESEKELKYLSAQTDQIKDYRGNLPVQAVVRKMHFEAKILFL